MEKAEASGSKDRKRSSEYLFLRIRDGRSDISREIQEEWQGRSQASDERGEDDVGRHQHL